MERLARTTLPVGSDSAPEHVRSHQGPAQVAEALLDYYELGVTTFLIRGFDPLDDVIDYGRNLLPLTRQLVAERVLAARVAA